MPILPTARLRDKVKVSAQSDCLSIHGNRLRVGQFAGAAVIVLEDNLGVGIGDPALVAELLGHVEDVVDLDDAEVRVESLEARQVVVPRDQPQASPHQ
jgi:hypothetical protein